MRRTKDVRRLGIFFMILAWTILACQGSDGSNPFATATPTFTPTPTITPSLTPTSIPTFTPTATPLPTGVIKDERADGTTIFTDYDGHYRVTFPHGWTVVLLQDEDLEAIFDRNPEQEENISKMLDSIKNSDVNRILRVVGFHFGTQQGMHTPNVQIGYDTNPITKAIALQKILDATVSYFPSLGIKVINSGIEETSSGIEYGFSEAHWSLKATNNQEVNLHQRQILFKSAEGLVVITYATLRDATVDLNPDIDKMIESVEMFK